MATAIAVILGVIALIGGVLWVATLHIRAVERERDEAVSRAIAAEGELATFDREHRALNLELSGAEHDRTTLVKEGERLRHALTDARTNAREAADRARSAETARIEAIASLTRAMGRLEAADDREKAWRGHIEKLEQTIGTLTTAAAQREANLRNDVEAERVLAAKSLDSLTQLATQLVTITTEMAGLQRIGFRPPMKEAETPKDSVVVGLPSVEDVDAELLEEHPELAARYD